MSFNKVVMLGNLTRDIELKYTQNGMAIAKTAIAVNRKFKAQNGEQKEETCFIDITLFGRAAEVANQYLSKGRQVLVEGRLVYEQWVDNSGQKRSKHSISVDNLQMLGSKEQGQGGAQQTPPQASGAVPPAPAAQPQGAMPPQPAQTVAAHQQPQRTPPQPQQQAYGGNYQNPHPTTQQQAAYQQPSIPEIDIADEDIPF